MGGERRWRNRNVNRQSRNKRSRLLQAGNYANRLTVDERDRKTRELEPKLPKKHRLLTGQVRTRKLVSKVRGLSFRPHRNLDGVSRPKLTHRAMESTHALIDPCDPAARCTGLLVGSQNDLGESMPWRPKYLSSGWLNYFDLGQCYGETAAAEFYQALTNGIFEPILPRR